MKYEIINPSDKCFISSENEKVACFCNLLIGNGRYALNRENGERADGIHIFGYSAEALNADYEGDFQKFADNHIHEIIDCFKSFEYARERTSLNNIGARAKALQEKFEQKLAEVQNE